MASFFDGGSCTGFPEVWLGVRITDCCIVHDNTCSTHKFYSCLNQKFKDAGIRLPWFHAGYITFGGMMGCLVKYPSKMIKKLGGQEMKLDEIDEAIFNKNNEDRKTLDAIIEEVEYKELEEIIDDTMLEEIQGMKEQVSNNEIFVEALKNKRVMYDIKSDINDLEKQHEKMNKDISDFLKKSWKLMLVVFFIASINGYFLAVFQHENIKPFLTDITKEVVKKAIHVSGE